MLQPVHIQKTPPHLVPSPGVMRDWISPFLLRMNGDGKNKTPSRSLTKKKRIRRHFPRRCPIPLLKISSSPVVVIRMSVFVLEGSGRKWIGVKKLKKLKNKGRRKRKLVLTMDDKFSSSLHRRRERQNPGRQMIFLVVASAADVATGGRNHYRIEGGANQFGVVILGRRNQL
jgi:hypothetical protein